MSSQKHNDKIIKWSNEEGGSKYVLYNNLLEYLGNNLFDDFEPTMGPFPDFTSRLEKWINNISDDDSQKILLELATRIFYVGSKEFISLYRTAYNSIIKRWLIDQIGADFDSLNYIENLKSALDAVWFLPITDSLRINQFYKVNQIDTKNTFRGDIRSMKFFVNNNDKFDEYILQRGIKYIVLLEDFVGSGTQALSSLKFVSELKNEIKVLFVPLIICHNGLDNIIRKMNSYSNFFVKPVISLDAEHFVNDDTSKFANNIQLYELLSHTFKKVKGSLTDGAIKKLTPYGYKNTGGLTVLYSNTPNNSLPLIFIKSDTWEPLFQRNSRD
ncbi:phosphoribosyltransferase-like protein [Larkinella punicea]|uniref:PRTase-CE domain-containing protein n=1 Tax=Larkinella punicea TaxID=2315727 RepID=A0A368JRU8_9BACT|nr:hypothetical protein [Larkinella punicea]RCR69686.1 hypothetical protein DUE52_10075 [Larkinella punicea]